MSENLIRDYTQPFSEMEELAWTLAIGCVMDLECATKDGRFIPPEGQKPQNTIRCHEIAHAIGRILRFPVQRGCVGVISKTHGGIDHSWLWTKPPPSEWTKESIAAWDGNILDPWVMGGFPRTQLVACHPALFQLGIRYRPSLTPRDDVDPALVNMLKEFFRAYTERVFARTKSSTP